MELSTRLRPSGSHSCGGEVHPPETVDKLNGQLIYSIP